mmetsp:Transcript_35805/g.100739  ORF Transcript_35805/g.100739 Transcript_35805/m.100739 type:complete len:276 (+) Transcript_35805:326-1153(+)
MKPTQHNRAMPRIIWQKKLVFFSYFMTSCMFLLKSSISASVFSTLVFKPCTFAFCRCAVAPISCSIPAKRSMTAPTWSSCVSTSLSRCFMAASADSSEAASGRWPSPPGFPLAAARSPPSHPSSVARGFPYITESGACSPVLQLLNMSWTSSTCRLRLRIIWYLFCSSSLFVVLLPLLLLCARLWSAVSLGNDFLSSSRSCRIEWPLWMVSWQLPLFFRRRVRSRMSSRTFSSSSFTFSLVARNSSFSSGLGAGLSSHASLILSSRLTSSPIPWS